MRWLLRVLLGLLLLLFAAALLLLVPPHIQVRRVEPPLPSAEDLRALLAVSGGPIELGYLTTDSQPMPDDRTLGHTVFLAGWPGGDRFMIDSGMDAETAAGFAELLKVVLAAGEAEHHGNVAELLGAGIERVAGVGFTHLHIDHTQGIVPFCRARGQGAAAYQTPWQAELHNFNTEEGGTLVAESCLEGRELRGDPIMASPDFPGLGLVGLGGHTPGSTLFAIPVDGHLWLFSGDTTNTKADILENRPKEFLYSYFMVPEHVDRTEALRVWLAELDAEDDMTVIVSHDLDDIRQSGMAKYDPSTSWSDLPQ